MPRILLLEDEPDLLDMMQSLLVAAGFEVAGTPDKDKGVGILQRSAFDLVLADLILDKRSTNTAWGDICELVALARPARVGIITGWPATAAQVEQSGVAFVLQKPCKRTVLLERIGDALHLPPLTEAQHAAIRTYFCSLEQIDLDSLTALVTEDVEYQLPGTDARFVNTIRGRDAFLAFTTQTFTGAYREPRFEVGPIAALPNGALVEYLGSWREGDTSRRLPGAVMFEFRDDRIARIGVRIDPDRLE